MFSRDDPTCVGPRLRPVTADLPIASADASSAADRPRVAVVHGTLRVPPTYFTIQHAVPLADRFDFTFFALATDVAEGASPFPVVDALGLHGRPFREREFLLPLVLGRLASAVEHFDPALVHQHFGTWSLPARRSVRRLRVPLVATLHGSDVFTSSYTGRDPRYRWHRANLAGVYAEADRILCVSRFLADAAVAAGAPPERVEVHHQGIDTDFLTPADQGASADGGPGPSATSTGGPPRVVFVGRLAAYKGVPDLVEASTALRARGVEHELVLVGDGPLRAELDALAEREQHVGVTGSLDRVGVREQLRAAHVVALPSTPREAAGLVLLEAQACGVPVVAYDGGGKPEMLRPGATGLLATQGDAADLAVRLEELLTLPAADHETMGRAAREFVVAERSLAVSAERLGEQYRSLLG